MGEAIAFYVISAFILGFALLVVLCVTAAASREAAAQDLFELEVFEFEATAPRTFVIGFHTNGVPRERSSAAGTHRHRSPADSPIHRGHAMDPSPFSVRRRRVQEGLDRQYGCRALRDKFRTLGRSIVRRIPIATLIQSD